MTLPSNISWYKDKHIAVVGLSVEGVDCVKFFSSCGAKVTCLDRREKESLGDSYAVLSRYTDSFILGNEYLSTLSQYDLIVRSPGIALHTKELSDAVSQGKIVTSLTKLFFSHCRAPIIGVTGTKGKGTTSSLIYSMVKQSGKTVWLGGNIGSPLLSQVDSIEPTDVVILELSSFQLEDSDISPHIAVVLKITQEHLANFDPNASNFHISRDAYVEAKRSIIRYQNESDYVIYTSDDETSKQFGETSKAQKRVFSRQSQNADAYVLGERVYLKEYDSELELCSLSTIKLRGIHNLENIAAATLASRLIGVGIDAIRSAVKEFEGLPHRLEFVKKLHDVCYINDSFSTVPETAIAAIESFSDPLVLILGGSEKGSDYANLGKKIAVSNIRTLIVIGDMTEKIVTAVSKSGYTGEFKTGLTSMTEIVHYARDRAQAGDVVLLSPACASFGMFKNYKERGKEFIHEVEKLS